MQTETWSIYRRSIILPVGEQVKFLLTILCDACVKFATKRLE